MAITRSQLKHASFWRERAEEARAIAAMHSDPKGKETLLDIADRYDLLARDAAQGVKSGKSKSGK